VPGARWGHTAVAHDGALYIFGGSMPGECFDEVTVITVTVTFVTVLYTDVSARRETVYTGLLNTVWQAYKCCC
jgi:hypothetical protein